VPGREEAVSTEPAGPGGRQVRTTGAVTGTAQEGAVPLKDVAVFLLTLDGRPPPLPGRAPRSAVPDTLVVDQLRLSFMPEVTLVSPGTVVSFLNSDVVQHNVFKAAGPGEPFNLGTYPRGDSRAHTFYEPGLYVMLCHVHPEMAAYVMVVPSEHRAKTEADGTFTIPDVPPGRYLIRGWHSRIRLEEQVVEVKAGGVTEVRFRESP
jgi:plastocyanin